MLNKVLKHAAHRWHVNPSMVRLEREVRAFSAALRPGSLVLDAGAGDCRYKPLFAAHRYESADFGGVDGKPYGTITYQCDLTRIPVEDGRFDGLICTQVLAHLPEPNAALKEMARVLAPGGAMLLSCPVGFRENEQPYDFFRYTQFGLRHLFDRAGLHIDRLDWLEGYFGAFQYQLSTAAISLPLRASDYGGGLLGAVAVPVALSTRVVCAVGCQVFTWFELRHKYTGRGQPINYLVLARKPAGNPPLKSDSKP